MPNWSKDDYESFILRSSSKRVPSPREVRSPRVEPVAKNDPVGSASREEKGIARVCVRIARHCHVKLDRANLSSKYLEDLLRYSGVIFDDSDEYVDLRDAQEVIPRSEEEFTTIEVTPI